MLRNYICPDVLMVRRSEFCGRAACAGGGGRRGFSLVELLVVVAIISVLMAAGGALFSGQRSRSIEPAMRIARSIELARAQAVASNRAVAIRFDGQPTGTRDLVMRILRSGSGNGAEEVVQVRRPQTFENLTISRDILHPGGGADLLPIHDLSLEEALVMTPDGQVLLGRGGRGFPQASDELLPVIRLGIQPTFDGKVVPSKRRDVAIVQVQCATGTARVILP